jgi:hypothetical protein
MRFNAPLCVSNRIELEVLLSLAKKKRKNLEKNSNLSVLFSVLMCLCFLFFFETIDVSLFRRRLGGAGDSVIRKGGES